MPSLSEINRLVKKSFLMDDKELSVYQVCLEYGFLNPSQVSRLTGIKRTTIYLVLEGLKQKGLLIEKIKGKKKIIGAAPPATLRHLIEQEEEKLKQKNEVVQTIIPILENFQKTLGEERGVEILEGKNGAVILLEKILQKKENIYWLGSFQTILNIIDEDRLYKLFTWKRMDQNTTSYAITDRAILKKPHFGERINTFRQFRFFEDNFIEPGLLVLFGKSVALINTTHKKTQIVLIHNPATHSVLKFLFDSLWKLLPEYKGKK